jgi:transcriptional regulator NrdR family protein
MQTTPQFNTHHVVKSLVAAGLKEAVAEVVVEAIVENNRNNLMNLATKADIERLEVATGASIEKLESKLQTEIDHAGSFEIEHAPLS